MADDRAPDRGWLRPLGLLLLALTLAVGQPILLMAVAFAMLTFLTPGVRNMTLLLAAFAFAIVFAGEPDSGLWYVERGWAVLVAGWFVAVSLFWPKLPFLLRGLASVAGGAAFVCLFVVALDGWSEIEWLVADRVQESVAVSLQMIAMLTEGEVEAGIRETLSATAEIQSVLFPALVGLSSLASLGVAWWLHVRVSALALPGLRSLREFRFPDALIWLFIVGLGLLVLAEWGAGWGRVGTNLVAFMGALYVLRGAGVLLFLSGGMGVAGGFLVAIGLLLAGPLLALGAMLVGVGDSWLDLRARSRRSADGGAV